MRFHLPVSSRGLRRRTVVAGDSPALVATVLPLFDREGTVRRILLLDAMSPDIWLFDPAESPVRIPLWGPIGVGAAPGAVRLLRAGQLGALYGLWHFDSRWLLRDERYRASEVAPTLQAGNCCELLPGRVTQVLYRWDLSRASGIVRRDTSGYNWLRFPRNALPEQPARPRSAPGPTAGPIPWRLAPVWLRSER